MRYLIQLAYKGTHYHGWQKQPNVISVQEVLDQKLSMLLRENIESLGCGRTDTGVHAKDFYAHFDSINVIDENTFIKKINSVLPNDIAVFTIIQVGEDFNARFDAEWREYEYWIIQKPNPFLVEESWYQFGALNIDAMNQAASFLIGQKDFECFSKVQTQVNNFICNVSYAKWEQHHDKLVFTIRANRFLRNMVRAIVGTLVNVGRGKLAITDVETILASKNRSEAGQSVPAQGLFLTKVVYPQN
ncbi:MAG: tRNA pseudouridine(38-40) synthase TruA [Bacteroidia bacterium]|nr:tRNA pseudouridine(38-40) synthase TruA [Bacteroidia bacterium]